MDYSGHINRIPRFNLNNVSGIEHIDWTFEGLQFQSIIIPFRKIKHSEEIWPRLVPEDWRCDLVEQIGNKAKVSIEIHWGTENQNESIGISPKPKPNE